MRELRRSERLGLSVVVLVAGLLYVANLGDSFLSDDWIFAHYARNAGPAELWQTFAPDPAGGPLLFYRPLGLALWELGELLGGSPLVQHGLGLALHLLNVALCFRLARRLGLATRTATCAAAIFALFPTHAEAVIWVSARFDLLATALMLAAVLLALRAGRAGPWLAALCGALALQAKESALVLPGLIALSAGYLQLQRVAPWPGRLRAVAGAALPSALVVAAYLALRLSLFDGAGGYAADGRPLAERLLAPLAGVGSYLSTPLRWDLHLSRLGELSAPEVTAAVAITALAVAAVAVAPLDRASGRPLPWALLLGLLWALCAAVPLVGTSAWSLQTLEGGRYIYLPAVGLSLGLASLICEPLARSVGQARSWRGGARLALLAVLLCPCVFTAVSQAARWSDASAIVRSSLAEIQWLYPDPPPQSTIAYELPDSQGGAYLFRNGVQEALRLTYGDSTLRAARLGLLIAGYPTPARPDQVYTAVFHNGEVRAYRDVASFEQDMLLRQAVPGLHALRWEGEFHAEERSGGRSWRWMGREGCLRLHVVVDTSIDLGLRIWSPGPARQVAVRLNDEPLRELTVDAAPQRLELAERQFPPGDHRLCFSADAAATAGPSDPRVLGVAIGDLILRPGASLGGIPDETNLLDVPFASGHRLSGYRLLRGLGPLQAEQQLTLLTYWGGQASRGELWRFVHLVDGAGRTITQADEPVPLAVGSAPLWRAVDTFTMPAGLTDGTYRLTTGLYDPATGSRVEPPAGGSPERAVTLESIEVRNRPVAPPWR